MPSFYERQRSSADAKLRQYGYPGELRFNKGVYDPLTGKVTDDEETQDVITLLFPVVEDYRDNVTTSDKSVYQALLSALDQTGKPLELEPKVGMVLKVKDIPYAITRVDPLRPGGLDLLYDLRVSV